MIPYRKLFSHPFLYFCRTYFYNFDNSVLSLDNKPAHLPVMMPVEAEAARTHRPPVAEATKPTSKSHTHGRDKGLDCTTEQLKVAAQARHGRVARDVG